MSEYITTSPVARQIPFDNSTDGFVSTDVQSAIEEVNAYVSVPVNDQSYYVNKNGSDTTGNGSVGKPYLTIGKALTTITDSSPTKRYTILVGPGDYSENLSLKANVFIHGATPLATRITGSTIDINDSTWNVASADNRSGFQDITINNVATWNFTSQTNNTDGKLYFWGIRTGAAWTITANSSINQLIAHDSEFFGTHSYTGMNTYIEDCAWQSGNVTVSSSSAAGIPALLTLVGGRITGNLTATWTSQQAVTLNLVGINIGSSTILTASGASCTVYANDGSLPVPANRTFSSSATLVRVNDNYANGLISATTNVDTTAATAPTAGQVLTATSSTVAVWATPTASTEVTNTSNATTTSGTDALLTSMTITPIAGTYLVNFASSVNTNSAGSSASVSLYIGGSQKAATLIKTSVFDGGTLSALNGTGGVSITSIVTVNGSQAIEVRWSVTAGTATCGARSMNIVKIG